MIVFSIFFYDFRCCVLMYIGPKNLFLNCYNIILQWPNAENAETVANIFVRNVRNLYVPNVFPYVTVAEFSVTAMQNPTACIRV